MAYTVLLQLVCWYFLSNLTPLFWLFWLVFIAVIVFWLLKHQTGSVSYLQIDLTRFIVVIEYQEYQLLRQSRQTLLGFQLFLAPVISDHSQINKPYKQLFIWRDSLNEAEYSQIARALLLLRS